MDFQDLLIRYFGEADVGAIEPSTLQDGLVRLRVDFGLEQDGGRRFALWAVMYMLGDAPDLDVAFKDAAARDAARNFMDMVDGLSENEAD
jgi:hypothetical protein